MGRNVRVAGYRRSWQVPGFAGSEAFPTAHDISVNIKQIKHASQCVVDNLFKTLGSGIKGGHWGIDDGADLGCGRHRPQMPEM